jgi:hypothetical protein
MIQLVKDILMYFGVSGSSSVEGVHVADNVLNGAASHPRRPESVNYVITQI